MEKKDRRKVVVIATVVVLLILTLIVAIVTVAVRRTEHKNVGGTDNTEFSLPEDSKPTEPQMAEVITTKPDTTEQSARSVEPDVPITSSTTNDAGEIPSTGPEDYLPVALMLGMLTTAVTSTVMARRSM